MSLHIQFRYNSVAFNYIIMSVVLTLYLSSCSGLQWNEFLYLMSLQLCDIYSACLLSNEHLAFVIWHLSFSFSKTVLKGCILFGEGKKKGTLAYSVYFQRDNAFSQTSSCKFSLLQQKNSSSPLSPATIASRNIIE